MGYCSVTVDQDATPNTATIAVDDAKTFMDGIMGELGLSDVYAYGIDRFLCKGIVHLATGIGWSKAARGRVQAGKPPIAKLWA